MAVPMLPPMTPPRFQFTIRNLLWATFWVAASCAAWAVAAAKLHEPDQKAAFNTFLLLAALAIITTSGTIGTFAKRTRWGLAAGIALAAVGLAILLACTRL